MNSNFAEILILFFAAIGTDFFMRWRAPSFYAAFAVPYWQTSIKTLSIDRESEGSGFEMYPRLRVASLGGDKFMIFQPFFAIYLMWYGAPSIAVLEKTTQGRGNVTLKLQFWVLVIPVTIVMYNEGALQAKHLLMLCSLIVICICSHSTRLLAAAKKASNFE